MSLLVSSIPLVKETQQQKSLRSEDSMILESLQIHKGWLKLNSIHVWDDLQFQVQWYNDSDTDSAVNNIGIDPELDADFSHEDEPDGSAKLPQYQMLITQSSLIESVGENSESWLAEKQSKKPSKARQLLKFINEVSRSNSQVII